MPYALMFRWAACTGLRRFELCGLRDTDLQNAYNLPSGLTQLTLTRKGSRTVHVYAPNKLIDETNWYFVSDRPQHARPIDRGHIFLTPGGRKIDKGRLSNEFRRVADQIGSNATLHHLRHTYAVTLYRHLERHADNGAAINPLKTLQVLLGHAQTSSTEIYLRALEIDSSAVHSALAYLYGETQ
ncbi:site-specific integrase [Bordetella sp. N]|uniref:tyrosine-type recombinase/integrase n=1 Tax=Bordetella sp. N TaxID=1746199 RepID=UPI0018D233A3